MNRTADSIYQTGEEPARTWATLSRGVVSL
jgi:hypothetical protein